MFKEKRKDFRRVVRCPAWIGTIGGAPLRGCMVSDISEDGARLDVESAEELPDEFQLLLSGTGGIYRKCRAIWRTRDQIGVQFEQPRRPQQGPQPASSFSAPDCDATG